jgi:hypothetical protein
VAAETESGTGAGGGKGAVCLDESGDSGRGDRVRGVSMALSAVVGLPLVRAGDKVRWTAAVAGAWLVATSNGEGLIRALLRETEMEEKMSTARRCLADDELNVV